MNPDDQIFVLKDGQRLGPFTPDALLEQIERGAVNYEDPCLQAGASACGRVRDVLDWDDDPPTADESTPETDPETAEDFLDEFGPEPEPYSETPPEEEPFEDEAFEEEDDDDDGFDLEEEIRETLEEAPIDRGPPSNPNTVLYAGHPSFLSFPRTVLLVLVSIGAGLWFRDTSTWIFLAGLIIGLFGVSSIFLKRSMRLYLITPKRVEIVTGLFAKSSNEVRIEDIRTINVAKSGFIGLIGIGTVEFASAGGGTVEVAFQSVWAAKRIKALVRRLQDVQDD